MTDAVVFSVERKDDKGKVESKHTALLEAQQPLTSVAPPASCTTSHTSDRFILQSKKGGSNIRGRAKTSRTQCPKKLDSKITFERTETSVDLSAW